MTAPLQTDAPLAEQHCDLSKKMEKRSDWKLKFMSLRRGQTEHYENSTAHGDAAADGQARPKMS